MPELQTIKAIHELYQEFKSLQQRIEEEHNENSRLFSLSGLRIEDGLEYAANCGYIPLYEEEERNYAPEFIEEIIKIKKWIS